MDRMIYDDEERLTWLRDHIPAKLRQRLRLSTAPTLVAFRAAIDAAIEKRRPKLTGENVRFAMSVECPLCKARPGKDCRSHINGQRMLGIHAARLELFRELTQDDDEIEFEEY